LTKISEALGVEIPEVKNSVFEINLDKLIEQLPEPKSYEDVLDLDSEEIVVSKRYLHILSC